MKYFAYGSNMSSREIGSWLDNPENVGVATLAGYRFAYNNRGQDGTGKGSINPSDEGVVYGVVYELTPQQLQRLDAKEPNYTKANVTVRIGGEEVAAITYAPNPESIDDTLSPTDEYRNRILTGAAENHLPASYTQQFLEKQLVLEH